MLGSHNSGSFAKQIGITKFIPRMFSSCQKLNFKEQYDIGVRMFDLRVTYYKGDFYLAHGLIRYDLKLSEALNIISSFKEPVIIGVMIEDTFLKFKGSVTELSRLINAYNIPLCYYLYKKDGANLAHQLLVSSIINWHIPVKRKYKLLIPKRDCKKINLKLNLNNLITSTRIHIVDFIELLK